MLDGKCYLCGIRSSTSIALFRNHWFGLLRDTAYPESDCGSESAVYYCETDKGSFIVKVLAYDCSMGFNGNRARDDTPS